MADGIKYLGHSAFYIKSGSFGILIDPWFMHDRRVNFDIQKENITHILITHGHSDHFGDTVNIAKLKNIKIIAIFETALYCQKLGLNAMGVGMSSKISTEFGSVRFFPATHTNSLPNGEYGGIAASILLEIDGIKIFHAGDTGLTKDMELVGKFYKPYYAMLPIGGHYTMDVEDAAIAAQMINAEEYIPMHYNTFDVISAEPINFKTAVEEHGKICHIMSINEELNF